MIRLTQLIGQQAVSLATAERTGKVTGIVVERNRIVAVKLDDLTIDAADVRSFDGDVLTYDRQHPDRSGEGAINPKGKRVLDVHGDQLGTISDLEIDADGTIATLVVDPDLRIDGRRLHAIGTYAAIVTVDLPPPTGTPVVAV